MMPPPAPTVARAADVSGGALAQAFAAALAWWHDAGVDGDWADAPHNWLSGRDAAAPAAAPPAPPALAASSMIAGGAAQWPATPAAFAAWWMAQADLAPAGAARVPPSGPTSPPLMIVVPMPEPDDDTALLTGPAGRLLDGFLAAAGLHRAGVYCAAALPARIAAPDWAALAEVGMGALLMHHIALIRPQRLLLFGQSGISTLLGNALPNKPTHLPMINHGGGMIPMLAAYNLATIVARPGLKAGLWTRWLDWMPAQTD